MSADYKILITEKRYQELIEKEKSLEKILKNNPELSSGKEVKLTPTAKKYKAALVSLASQVEKVMTSKELLGIFEVAHVHGFRYNGPGFGDELNKVNKLLGKI